MICRVGQRRHRAPGMAGENRTVIAAPFSNEVIQVLHMHSDREWSVGTGTLKGLEHMPPLAQFSGEWRHVPGRCGSAVQRDNRHGPGPVLPHHKIGHATPSVEELAQVLEGLCEIIG